MRGSGAKVGCRDTSLKGPAVTLETEQREPEAPAGGGGGAPGEGCGPGEKSQGDQGAEWPGCVHCWQRS